MEDEGDRNVREADLCEVQLEQALRGALSIDATLSEAHRMLADLYGRLHRTAERSRDRVAAERASVLMRSHIDALPADDAARHALGAYLRGDGALSLVTDPPGAAVLLYGYSLQGRRLAPRFLRPLGQTPLENIELPTGSYLLILRKPGYADARYPVFIGRQEHWDGRDATGTVVPVQLVKSTDLEESERYVPAGWTSLGGDTLAANTFPSHHAWVDAFVVQRVPVSNRDYLAFLNDLVERGRVADALSWAPRERTSTRSMDGPILYARAHGGHFVLQADSDGDLWQPDWPVMMIDWASAKAYAAWHATRTALPWRLPEEAEWEKAARGVDERAYPWGDFADPSWCCVRDSHAARPLPTSVESFPEDEGPYGIRGMAGNVRQWCDGWFDSNEALRPARGGSWGGTLRDSRTASRIGHEPWARQPYVGFRLVRGLAEPGPRR
jgi:serine/threonine-protein kinase